ncbi:MAG: WG repeat-containing protein [Clostridia bacterium]|nr:WG repeat-containing protein [Clostridia bacterium]
MSENLIQFVLEAQKGNEDSFAKLYSRTLKSSYYLALKLTADDAQAQEVLKKAYAQAFCTLTKLKRPEAFEAWIKQKVAGAYKETQNFVYSDADGDVSAFRSEFLPVSVLADESLSKRIEEGVACLPKEQRAVTVLHYYVGMPTDFIAKFLSVSESTVNSLLAKARTSIVALLPRNDESLAEENLPVLTRIFQSSASKVVINNELVRSVFIFAIDAYENKDKVVEAAPGQPVEEPAKEEPAAEPEAKAEETNDDVKSDAEDSAEQDAQPAESAEEENAQEDEEPRTIIIDNKTKPSQAVVSGEDIFKEIDLGLVQLGTASDNAQPDAPVSQESSGVYIGKAKAPAQVSVPESDEAQDDSESGKKKLQPKTIIYIVLISLLVIAVAVSGILIMNKDKNEETTTGNVAVTQQGEAVKSLWTPELFPDYDEISYFNEKCCIFKSAETGKYGLMDYQGNVVLEPNYVEFVRCSHGRDYTQRDSYHYLVRIEAGGSLYEISMVDYTVSSTVHATHSSTGDELNERKYSERDRYHNGYAAVRDAETGKWGYVSQQSDKLVIDCLYEAVNDGLSSEQYAMVDYCLAVDNGMVAVKKGGKMGVVDVSGNVIVNFEYDSILQGDAGVFIACKNGVWGILCVGQAVDTFELPETTPQPGSLDAIYEYATPLTGSYEVVDSTINVRTEPGATGDDTLLGEIDEGTIVTVVAEYKDDNGKKWICFEYEDSYGWARATYLEESGI